MKKTFFILITFALTISCSTSHITSGQQTTFDNKHFKINVERANSSNFGSIHLDFGYYLEINGDSVDSHLPYFGRAYNIPLGGGKGLDFKCKLTDYKITHPKKDLTRFYFRVTNEEDSYKYTIEIFNNGRTTIYVVSNERAPINFDGTQEE